MFGLLAKRLVRPSRFALRKAQRKSGLVTGHDKYLIPSFAKANKMVLSVIWTRTSLIQFYQRRGYQLNGERLPFPYGDERFGKPKRDDLYFLVMDKSLA